jgi:membrane protease subunit HflC
MKKSQIIRGEGDAIRNRTYAEAFKKDVEFFSFYRSLQAYRTALQTDDTTMVLSPDSDFFTYFGSIDGKK